MPFIIEKERDPLYKDGLQKGIEKGIEKGVREGKKEGMEKGSKEAKITIAKKMLKQKLEVELISDITGLSQTEIEKIAKQ